MGTFWTEKNAVPNPGEFAHRSFPNSLKSNEQLWAFAQITQDKWATVSESLRSLMTKEGPWANPSGPSWQMSDNERFVHVAHDKRVNERIIDRFFWVNHSFALSFTKNEWFAHNFLNKILLVGTFVARFTSDSLIPSFLMSNVSKSLRLLTKNEHCEQMAQVAHQKWATKSA